MTIGQRLTQLKKMKVFSVDSLSELLGCSETAISYYLNDKRQVSNEYLKKITNEYKINLNWLITGKEEIFLSTPPIHISSKTSLPKPNSGYTEYHVEMINEHELNLPTSQLENSGFWGLPLWCEVSAGMPVSVDSIEPIGTIPIPKDLIANPSDYFGLKINGNSMSPEIEHGDFVIMYKPQNTDQLNGKIIAVNTGDGITIKRYILDYKENTAYLCPVNKDHGRIHFHESNQIFGVLKHIIRLLHY